MKPFQALRYGLVLAAFALAGGALAAPIHPISYDPPTGSGTLDSNGCTPGDEFCSIDLLTTLITDSFGNVWQLPGPLLDIASEWSFDEGGNLQSIQTPPFEVDLVSGDGCGDGCGGIGFAAFNGFVSQQIGCSSASFRLNIENTTLLENDCNVFNQGTYIIGPPLAAPEPGSLALIGGGLAAAWALRRRRRAA